MTSRLIRSAAAASMALFLAACGSSPPNDYYRLMPRAQPTTTGEQPALGVGPVAIPHYLNRGGMVYSTGGNRLFVAEQHRWAEPLDEGVMRVVALNLARLLHTDNLRLFPWDMDDVPDYTLELNVLELNTEDSDAVLIVDWVIRRPQDHTVVERRISRLRKSLPPGPIQPASLAPAYSELFFQLSEDIGSVITATESARSTDGLQ